MITNLIGIFSILLIPMSFIFMFGFMIKKLKQGKTLFTAMLILFMLGLAVICILNTSPIRPSVRSASPGR